MLRFQFLLLLNVATARCEARFRSGANGCGDKNGEIVELNNAVFDLKQAGRKWLLRLSNKVFVKKV